LSNALGTQPVQIGAVEVALRAHDSTIVAATARAVTFGGRASFAIQPGSLVVSDAVSLRVPALTEVAVSLYLPEDTRVVTTHEIGLSTTYVAPGNVAAAASLPSSAATNLTYFWLAGIEVLASAEAGTIVAFGDSITDGVATTPDTHRTWPALLAAKLQSGKTRHWAVVNAGISGNRVRRDVIGTSALGRFDRDVLGRAGVEWLVLLEGINDITFSALPRAPVNERTTAEQLIEGLEQLVDRAHAHGLRVAGGTLLPMGGLWLHNDETEAMRQRVNDWIRTSGVFDAVVDFDAVTRDPQRRERLRAELDSGDHIHPNDAGNAAMAEAIDVSIFDR
jgi:lysophospholipase L1-like esterase